ncbi:helix-turn-helix domain-containing protein [Nocardia sp. CA-119907]|uniref:helix-turn-helix domain-containing protein n=1 Tax=Nocardia sp. CA-119907 TaxID=3239973 RepID=UPI003D999EFE
MDPTELVLHPVRLRIIHALSGGRLRIAGELCDRMPDVPRTSVYRQLGLLTEGGMLEIRDERRVHGAAERSYRLRPDRPTVSPEVSSAMTPHDQLVVTPLFRHRCDVDVGCLQGEDCSRSRRGIVGRVAFSLLSRLLGVTDRLGLSGREAALPPVDLTFRRAAH